MLAMLTGDNGLMAQSSTLDFDEYALPSLPPLASPRRTSLIPPSVSPYLTSLGATRQVRHAHRLLRPDDVP